MSGHGEEVTWLFVPGNTPARFDKAAASGADAVIVDLEDAVRPQDKDAARLNAVRWLSGSGHGWVRVNAADTHWFADDLEALAPLPGLKGVVLPKAEEPEAVTSLASRLTPGAGVLALVETALGIHRAADLAQAPGMGRLAFGSVDFAGDIGADESDEALLAARSALVLASRVAHLPPPVDGVTTSIHDDAAVHRAARRSRGLGFGAKLCIHPAQIAATATAFAPSEQEVHWAREVLSVADGSIGAVAGPDGQMVDKPVVERAHAILARVRRAQVSTLTQPSIEY